MVVGAMLVRNKIPVPQERLPGHLPAQAAPTRRGVSVLAVMADVVAQLREEMPGADTADIVAELVSRLETALPGITFNRDALRAHAEAIHRLPVPPPSQLRPEPYPREA